MNENTNESQKVLKKLCAFYVNNKSWITDYKDYTNQYDEKHVKRDIRADKLDDMLNECSVAILTANKVELSMMTCKLFSEKNKNNHGFKEPLSEIYVKKDDCLYQFARISNINIVHIHPNHMSSFTKGGSADAVSSALQRFRPKLVISLGVAFGIDPDKQDLGDVLLSSSLVPYDTFNKDINGSLKLDPKQNYDTNTTLNAWKQLVDNNAVFSLLENDFHKSIINRDISFNWKFGSILSGGSVLSNAEKKQALLRAANRSGVEDIIGGEMEGAGVYHECEKKQIPCIVIKGICDYGEDKNSWVEVLGFDDIYKVRTMDDAGDNGSLNNDLLKDCVQAYAAENAIEALFRLLIFDNQFLYNDEYESNAKEAANLKPKVFSKISLGLVSSFFRIVLPIVLLDAVVFLFLLFSKWHIASFINDGVKDKRIFLYFVIQIVVLIIGTLFEVHRRLLYQPFNAKHDWASFELINYNRYKNINETTDPLRVNIIKLNDQRTIYNITILRWMAPGKTILNKERVKYLKANEVYGFSKSVLINNKNFLQIEYNLNENHYVHLINRSKLQCLLQKKGKMDYSERIYIKEGKQYKLINKQNSVVKTEYIAEERNENKKDWL